jgi:hypothetical protein
MQAWHLGEAQKSHQKVEGLIIINRTYPEEELVPEHQPVLASAGANSLAT